MTCWCEHKPSFSRWTRFLILVISLVSAFFVFREGFAFEWLLRWAHGMESLWGIFLLGLVASFSSCLATTWAIFLAFGAQQEQELKKWKKQMLLHLWRLVSFVIGGGILGLLGKSVGSTLGLQMWLQTIVGILLVIMWLQYLWLIPALSWKRRKKTKNTFPRLSLPQGLSAFLIGAGTFFVPCGFTQMVQLMALGSGSLWLGSAMMWLFALWTLPWLGLISRGSSFMRRCSSSFLRVFLSFLLLLFGFLSLWTMISLQGRWEIVNQNSRDTMSNEDASIETIKLSHNGFSFEPSDIKIKAGTPYRLRITPESDGLGCMSTVTLPRIDDRVIDIVKGKDIVYELAWLPEGQYPFVCWSMGMEQGRLIVEK